MSPSPTPERHFLTDFLATWVVELIFLCPLFFHLSDETWLGPYSAPYLALLIVATQVSFAVAALTAHRCRVRRSRAPALATITVVLSVFLTLFLVECALRVFQPESADTFATYRQWGHRKSILFGFEADFNHEWTIAGATYHTDSSGFRRRVQDPNWRKDHTRKRIFTLGESSVFGYGLDDDETWPHRLEEKLKARTPPLDYAVINAGNNGHNSLQSMLRFYLRVLPEKPDDVIYYAAINDVINARLQYDAFWITSDILFLDSLSSYLRKTRQYQNVYARSVLGVIVSNQWDALLGIEPSAPVDLASDPSPAGDARDIEARFQRNVLTLLDMCRRAGARLVLTTFVLDDGKVEHSYVVGVQRRNEKLRQVATSEGLTLIDLDREFSDTLHKADYFFDAGYHPNELGAEWIAGTIAERLPPILLDAPPNSTSEASHP